MSDAIENEMYQELYAIRSRLDSMDMRNELTAIRGQLDKIYGQLVAMNENMGGSTGSGSTRKPEDTSRFLR